MKTAGGLDPGTGPGSGPGFLSAARRGLGAILLGLTLLPVYRLLEPRRIGPFGSDVRAGAGANLEFAWWGMGLAILAGLALAILLPWGRVRRAAESAARVLERPSLPLFAAGTAALAGTLALASTLLVFRGLPTGVDEMASLLQARYLAAGSPAGPVLQEPAAHLVVNTILTPEGWVSFYPPTHLLVLAAGLATGALALVPALLLAVLAGTTALAAHRILGPGRRIEARVGSLLVAMSPFLFFLGGTYLSHGSAAVFLAGSLLAGLAAREGHGAWSVAAGLGVGLAVTSRPWTGLVAGFGVTGGLWLADAVRRPRSGGWLLRRMTGATLGGAPLAAAWLLYNERFFGSPLTVGYTYAYGSAHGLGFHRDPWGNVYGLVEAVGYTSADLTALGVHLLETPVPAVALVGLWLAGARRTPRGTGILLAWALLPVAANFFYWHHGSHLGPRMLFEAAPAWILLAVLAASGLVRALRRGATVGEPLPEGPSEPPPGTAPAREGAAGGRHRGLPAPARIGAWALGACLLSAPLLATMRARAYRWDDVATARFRLPDPPAAGPSLIFVHGTWAERITARLQAAGMRSDSIETGLRRNDVCRLHHYALERARFVATPPDPDASSGPVASLPELDLRPLPGTPDLLRFVELSPGNRVRVDPRVPPTPECRREARSDRLGVVALAPLLWQGDLPGIDGGRPLVVRDMGPGANARVLRRHPDHAAYVLAGDEPGSPPVLHPYPEGIDLLWGE